MTIPPLLKKHDAVGIIAPSRLILPDQVETALEVFKAWGLEVHQGDALFEKHGYFGGTDDQRLADLQHFIDNPSIKAIFCARGG
ncbi:MAG: LD-carboxypeptidase, partial [Bacteroidota bacterium]